VAKGREASGKKDDLIEILLQVGLQEEAAAKRRAELKAMEVTELKKLLQSKALELSSKREDMVETFLAYEAVSSSMQRSRRGRRSGRKRLALSSRTCVPAKTSSQE